jgi:fatty-acyl-CoA synthase
VGKASIIVKDKDMSTSEVLEFLRPRIGKFKIPKYIEFVDDLPRTATGKIQKYLLGQRSKKEEGKMERTNLTKRSE